MSDVLKAVLIGGVSGLVAAGVVLWVVRWVIGKATR